MNIEIRKLTPDLADDYVNFFDVTPHDDNIDEHKCYCVCWCNDDYEGKDFSSRAKRRDYARQYVRGDNIQGYLAYCGDRIVGWCNANTKADCLKCESWRRSMGSIPTEDPASGLKVKSIFCFTIAPEMKRRGIAKQLLERVCHDAAGDGFDFIEAYPNKEFTSDIVDFRGPVELYRKCGFLVYCEAERKVVMRKRLVPIFD